MLFIRNGHRPGRWAVLVAALAIVVGAVAPPQAVAASDPVVAAIALPAGDAGLDEVSVGSSVWTLAGDQERGYLFQIDPGTNQITARIDLAAGTPGGNANFQGALAYAFGSLWVAETFRNQVWRIDPATATVVAKINTGRYPQLLTAGTDAIWVAQAQAESVARIDPATNRIVAKIPVGDQGRGTDEPNAVSFDPYRNAVLVTLPASHRVAVIDAATRVVDTFSVAPALACGRAVATRDGFWLDDSPCSNDLFRWDTATAQVVAHINPDPRDVAVYGIAVRNNVLYTGEGACGANGCQGAVVKRDADTGAVRYRVRTPSAGAFLPDLAAGGLWVTGFDGVLVHLRAF